MREVCSHIVLRHENRADFGRQLALPARVSRCGRMPLGVVTSTSKERKRKATELSICLDLSYADVECVHVTCVLWAMRLSVWSCLCCADEQNAFAREAL